MQSFQLLDRALLPPPPDWLAFGLAGLGIAAVAASVAHIGIERRGLAAVLAVTAPVEAPAQAPAHADQQQVANEIARLSALRDALRQTGDGVPNAGGTLLAIVAALPADTWLSTLELHGERGVRISGHALQPKSVAQFSAALSRLPNLAGVPLQAINIEPMAVEVSAAAASAVDRDDDSGALRRLATHRFVLAADTRKESE